VSEPSAKSFEVLPRREASEVIVGMLTTLYVSLFGPVVGLIWTAVSPKLSISALLANSDGVFHAQIGADAWFLLVGGLAGVLSALVAWLVHRWVLQRHLSAGVAVGLAVGGALAAIIADRVGYLYERGVTSEALRAIGANPAGSAIAEIDFRIRALGVLTVWPLAALVVLGILTSMQMARR
jgi:hypothetical protein